MLSRIASEAGLWRELRSFLIAEGQAEAYARAIQGKLFGLIIKVCYSALTRYNLLFSWFSCTQGKFCDVHRSKIFCELTKFVTVENVRNIL